MEFVCVCVCVTEKERERERARAIYIFIVSECAICACSTCANVKWTNSAGVFAELPLIGVCACVCMCVCMYVCRFLTTRRIGASMPWTCLRIAVCNKTQLSVRSG